MALPDRSDESHKETNGSSAPQSAAAAEELFALVYDELRRLAEHQISTEPVGHTLQATALVHEAYLKLSHAGRTWSDRRQFFAAAAEAMRRILCDHARRRKRLRRGGGRTRIETDVALLPELRPDDEVLALAEALSDFEREDARGAELVKLRYFAGLSLEESAEVMNISRSTASRDWTYAKAWLHRRLAPEEPCPGSGPDDPREPEVP